MDEKNLDEKNLDLNRMNQKNAIQDDRKNNSLDEKENIKKTSFIKNPLPLPKKHIKKEMEYDFEISEDQMHFDIEKPDKNYYDI